MEARIELSQKAEMITVEWEVVLQSTKCGPAGCGNVVSTKRLYCNDMEARVTSNSDRVPIQDCSSKIGLYCRSRSH